MIVFTSDHGDYLGDHWLGEKEFFHEPSVKIPLIICDPDRLTRRAAACATNWSRRSISRRRFWKCSAPIRRSSRTGSKDARSFRCCAARRRRTGAIHDQRIRLLDPAGRRGARSRAARCAAVHDRRQALETDPRHRLPPDAVRSRERSARIARSWCRSGLRGRTRSASPPRSRNGACGSRSAQTRSEQQIRNMRGKVERARHSDRRVGRNGHSRRAVARISGRREVIACSVRVIPSGFAPRDCNSFDRSRADHRCTDNFGIAVADQFFNQDITRGYVVAPAGRIR